MKRFIAAAVFVCLLLSSATGQNNTATTSFNTGTISSSGGSFTLINAIGGMTAGFEYKIVGGPGTLNIVASGCFTDGTCDVLNTYTTVANTIVAPTISKPYVKFTVTASWTGGSGVSVKVNALSTIARKGSGGGGTWGSITGTLSDQTDLQAALDAKLSIANNLSEIASPSAARGNLNAQINLGITAKTGSGTEVPGLTSTSLTDGDVLCYASSGTTWKNCEPGISSNTQTGTSYALVTGDKSKSVTFANGSAIAVSLAQAGTTGFDALWNVWVRNINAKGGSNVTITPTTSTIGGASTLVLIPGQGCLVKSDGANYILPVCGYRWHDHSDDNHGGQIDPTTGLSAAVGIAKGGTALTTAADDTVLVGNGTTYDAKTVPDCQDSGGNHLNYTQSTNSISCGTSGGSGSGISRPNTKHFAYLAYTGGGAFSGFGEAASCSGTCTANVAATSTNPGFSNAVSAATTNNNAGYSGTNINLWRTGRSLVWQWSGLMREATVVRQWVCAVTDQSAATMLAADNPAGNYACFRFSTNASDANVKCVLKDGTTQSVTAGSQADFTAYHTYEIDDGGSSYTFKIDGATYCGGAISSNVPTSGTNHRWVVGASTLENVAKNVDSSHIYIEVTK